MPFLRFTRDKRGYEQFALVQPVNRRGKTVSRVLYWFRTPPDIKIGREPFDETVRRALEAQNPDVTFDWRKILETPIPSADADKWRERRRVERSERAARQASALEDEELREAENQTPSDAPVHVIEAAIAEAAATKLAAAAEGRAVSADQVSGDQVIGDRVVGDLSAAPPRRRRRRRGGRGRPASPQQTPTSADTIVEPAAPSPTDTDE